jgi:lipoate-protein ligase A
MNAKGRGAALQRCHLDAPFAIRRVDPAACVYILARMPWRIVLDEPLPAALNMAIDEALLDHSRAAGESILRVYGWSTPTLSLGRNQPARGCYSLERAAELGVGFVRRPTGGRAVLHNREITYSVVAPAAALGDLAESYARINHLLVDALRRLGVDAAVASGTAPPPLPGLAPCFETPVAGEIVARGRKLVGSAQLRDRGAMLQHGSILVHDDQTLAAQLLIAPQMPPPPPATLGELLESAPDARDLACALLESVRALEDPTASMYALDGEIREAARAHLPRYESAEWTWRL